MEISNNLGDFIENWLNYQVSSFASNDNQKAILFVVGIVILIFSIVLNRYFLKPIKNLVDYTKIIKSKSKKETKIDQIKNRNDD